MAAITEKLYRKHPEAWWVGKRVRLLREVAKFSGEADDMIPPDLLIRQWPKGH